MRVFADSLFDGGQDVDALVIRVMQAEMPSEFTPGEQLIEVFVGALGAMGLRFTRHGERRDVPEVQVPRHAAVRFAQWVVAVFRVTAQTLSTEGAPAGKGKVPDAELFPDVSIGDAPVSVAKK